MEDENARRGGELTLTRRRNEEIVIDAFDSDGAPIKIVVRPKEIRYSQVRIGVSAPGLNVYRAELED